MSKANNKKTGAAVSATKAPVSPSTQVSQPNGQVMKPNGKTPTLILEAMKTSQLITAAQTATIEMNGAASLFVQRAKELYPIIQELETRFQKLPGQRNDLDDADFGNMGWFEFLRSIGVNPSTFRNWKSRMEQRVQNLIDATEVQVAGDLVAPISAVRPSSKSAKPTGEQQKREEVTQALLTQQKDTVDSASDTTLLPPLPCAGYTREQADSDATMRMTTELVGKHVWLARSAEAFVLVLAFDKATAEEIADLNGVVPVSCINVDFAETAVIMQGVIDGSQGGRFSMKEPSEVEKTDAKKPAESETTMDELVEAA